MQIDWKRVAEPQADGYDIEVMLDHLTRGHYGERPRRGLPNGATKVWEHAEARFISIEDYDRPSMSFEGLPRDHPNVVRGLQLLELWPEIKPLAQRMILCPLTTGHGFGGHGCTCGNYGDDWGWIYCSADNAWGLAEGIVHEMNHWKLRAFGIWFESWTDLILANDPKDLYTSPVRKDMPRPMGAVMHAQYSYIAVAEMCVRMLAAEPKATRDDIEWTRLQISRITEGQATLRAHAIGTPGVGEHFLNGMDAWTSRVIEQGNQLIGRLTA